MAERNERRGGETSRPQEAGEAATTRFGMEEGDNRDVPASGGPLPEASEDSDENEVSHP